MTQHRCKVWNQHKWRKCLRMNSTETWFWVNKGFLRCCLGSEIVLTFQVFRFVCFNSKSMPTDHFLKLCAWKGKIWFHSFLIFLAISEVQGSFRHLLQMDVFFQSLPCRRIACIASLSSVNWRKQFVADKRNTSQTWEINRPQLIAQSLPNASSIFAFVWGKCMSIFCQLDPEVYTKQVDMDSLQIAIYMLWVFFRFSALHSVRCGNGGKGGWCGCEWWKKLSCPLVVTSFGCSVGNAAFGKDFKRNIVDTQRIPKHTVDLFGHWHEILFVSGTGVLPWQSSLRYQCVCRSLVTRAPWLMLRTHQQRSW